MLCRPCESFKRSQKGLQRTWVRSLGAVSVLERLNSCLYRPGEHCRDHQSVVEAAIALNVPPEALRVLVEAVTLRVAPPKCSKRPLASVLIAAVRLIQRPLEGWQKQRFCKDHYRAGTGRERALRTGHTLKKNRQHMVHNVFNLFFCMSNLHICDCFPSLQNFEQRRQHMKITRGTGPLCLYIL